jgi:hypothetical protein
VHALRTHESIVAEVDPRPPASVKPGSDPVPLTRKNLSCPLLTSSLIVASVGSGTDPLNPPRASTSCPVDRMYGDASSQDPTAIR